MPVYWIIAIVIVALYFLWMGQFYSGWIRTPSECSPAGQGRTFVSILVPVRNEEINILWLFDDLSKQDYPQNLIEILIVDDHSSDLTPDIVEYFAKRQRNIKYIKLDNNTEGKNSAIHEGINASRFSLILTTDADCRLSPGWIKSMVECLESTGADLLAGPVLMKAENGFFNKFQRLEFFSLLGTYAGSINTWNPVMYSSSNLGFRKSSYLKVIDIINGDFPGGDNIFMLLAMHRKTLSKIMFLKNPDASVTTNAQPDLEEFLKQRKRWASESRRCNSKASVFTSLLAFAIHFYGLVCLITGLFWFPLLSVAAFILIAKSLLDFPFLYSVTGYFGERKLMRYFPAIQVLNFFYISFTAITAFTGVFEWKGRLVKN